MTGKWRFLLVYTVPLSVAVSFLSTGWLTWVPVMYAFGFVPLMEFLVPPDTSNLSPEGEEKALAVC